MRRSLPLGVYQHIQRELHVNNRLCHLRLQGNDGADSSVAPAQVPAKYLKVHVEVQDNEIYDEAGVRGLGSLNRNSLTHPVQHPEGAVVEDAHGRLQAQGDRYPKGL